MSNQPKPFEELDIYNSVNYPSSSVSATLLNFPVAQGTETMPYGVIWGDGTYQNSANPGGYSLTVQDGTTTVTNVNDINVTNGTLTNNGGGSVSINTGGGGGGGVQNPMTSNLDGGGFDIFNITNLTALNEATLPTIVNQTINNSEPVQYYNQGAVAPGGTNLYFVADMDPRANGEAHCLVVSRCLDPGLKQTTVFSISSFASRSSIDVHMNLTEGDTPVFDAVVVGDNGTQMFAALQCVAASSTWEIRVYHQQNNKGTQSSYGTPWNIITPATPAPNPVTLFATALLVSINPYGSKTFTGSQVTNGSISSDSLSTTNQISSGTTLTAGTSLFTNEIRDNGIAPIGVFSSISLQGNDIQSVNTIGCNIVSGPASAPYLKIGDATNGPLYVDGTNRRVGIGVPVPTEDLEIDGNIQLDTGSTSNSIKFYDSANAHDHAWITAQRALVDGGELVVRTKQDGSTLQDRLTVKEDGRVVITNRVEGLPNPVNGTDAANKQYVDASIPSLTGYVQNPMTTNLDGGQFSITNLVGLQVDNTASGGPNSVSFNLVGSGSVFEANAASLMKLGGSTIFTDPLRISGITDEVEIGQFNDGATTTTCVSVEHNATRAITTFNEAQYFNHNDPDAHETFPYTFFRDVVTTNITSLRQDGPDLRFAPNNVNGQVEMPEIKLPPTSNPATFRNIGVVRTDNITAEDPIVTVDGVVAGTTKVVEVGGQCAGLLCGFQSIGGTGDYALPYSVPGVGWDNSDDQSTIKLFPLNSPFRNQGLAPGLLNYYITSEYPPNSYYTGFSLFLQVQWIPTGGATVDLCYGNSSGAFSVVEANVLTGPGFNLQRQLSKNDWISIPFGSGDSFFLKLNIPPGAQIDAQEVNNAGCLQFVPFYKSLLVVD
jgi:hypothetical protein